MRIRTIKPEFFSSETLAQCSVPARITFIGLWCFSDDFGRAKANPMLVKAALWPLDDAVTVADVAGYLAELEAKQSICRYEVDGCAYLHVPAWEKHQASAYRRGKALHPAPPRVQKSAGTRNLEQGTGNREQGNAAPLRFDEFWDSFGLKLDKQRAVKAWAKAAQSTDPDIIIAGARRYVAWLAVVPNPPAQQYAEGWLSARRWEDVLPVPNSNGKGLDAVLAEMAQDRENDAARRST